MKSIKPISIQEWSNTEPPKVSICSIAYNHEKYIKDAIDGFLNQLTDFKVEIIIHDDASTDNTKNIIKEYANKYPHLIKTIFQRENIYSQGGSPGNLTRSLSSGEYIAMCEGDDYWTDPLKLYKQVHLLNKKPECSLSFHAYNVITNDGIFQRTERANNGSFDFPLNKIVKVATRKSQTATLVFRSKYLQELPTWFLNAPTADIALKLLLLLHGKAAYVDDIMSVYRTSTEYSYSSSVRNSVDKFKAIKKARSKMWQEFNQYTNLKFNSDVIEQIMIAEMQIPINQNVLSRLLFFLRNKHTKAVLKLPMAKMLRVIGICVALMIDPNLRQRNYFDNPIIKRFYKI